MADIKLTLVVACALVDSDNRVLVTQRPEGKALAGLWEFPGGKLEAGERPEPAFLISKPYTEEQVRSAVSQAMFFSSTEGLTAA